MAEPGEFYSAPGPAASWTRSRAESVSVGLLQGRRGRVAWANSKLAELAGEIGAGELEGRALDTLVMDAGGGLPEWVSSGVAEAAVECWLLRREKDPLTVAVRCLGEGEVPGESWWEVHRVSHHLIRANRELEELVARVERNTGEREELLTVVSHELRSR